MRKREKERKRIFTHEEIVGLGTKATDSEKLHHIKELAVNVATDLDGYEKRARRESETADGDGSIDDLDVALFEEDLAGLEAETLYVFLRDGLTAKELGNVTNNDKGHMSKWPIQR